MEGELNLLSNNVTASKAEIRQKQKEITKRLKTIESSITEEAKPLIKEYFDYEIPIAMVKDAGITTTGTQSESNQLPQLQDEYFKYRIEKRLWDCSHILITYKINHDEKIIRISDNKEVELPW